MNAQRAASSICRGEWSFAAGLLNAAAQAVADQLPVLYVCYDSPLPSPMCEVMPVIEAMAIALVLTPNAGPDSLATWELDVVSKRGPATWHEWIPAAWHANACARGFAALESLANPACTAVSLPLSPELDLALTRP